MNVVEKWRNWRVDRSFRCFDCKCDTYGREYYVLHDEVWRRANPKGRGMLCVGCLETRIGRRLRPEDFHDCPVNKYVGPLHPWAKTRRLVSRITGQDEAELRKARHSTLSPTGFALDHVVTA